MDLNGFSVFLPAVYLLTRQRFGFLPDEIAPLQKDEEGGAEAIKKEEEEIEGEKKKKENFNKCHPASVGWRNRN